MSIIQNINYPFIAVDEMRGFVDKIHEKGKKVKIYLYRSRTYELHNRAVGIEKFRT